MRGGGGAEIQYWENPAVGVQIQIKKNTYFTIKNYQGRIQDFAQGGGAPLTAPLRPWKLYIKKYTISLLTFFHSIWILFSTFFNIWSRMHFRIRNWQIELIKTSKAFDYKY